ncbi:MAG: hypothetical protein QXL51_00670 [Candidatus Aenigmatarchaeota archaeon]
MINDFKKEEDMDLSNFLKNPEEMVNIFTISLEHQEIEVCNSLYPHILEMIRKESNFLENDEFMDALLYYVTNELQQPFPEDIERKVFNYAPAYKLIEYLVMVERRDLEVEKELKENLETFGYYIMRFLEVGLIDLFSIEEIISYLNDDTLKKSVKEGLKSKDERVLGYLKENIDEIRKRVKDEEIISFILELLEGR